MNTTQQQFLIDCGAQESEAWLEFMADNGLEVVKIKTPHVIDYSQTPPRSNYELMEYTKKDFEDTLTKLYS